MKNETSMWQNPMNTGASKVSAMHSRNVNKSSSCGWLLYMLTADEAIHQTAQLIRAEGTYVRHNTESLIWRFEARNRLPATQTNAGIAHWVNPKTTLQMLQSLVPIEQPAQTEPKEIPKESASRALKEAAPCQA